LKRLHRMHESQRFSSTVAPPRASAEGLRNNMLNGHRNSHELLARQAVAAPVSGLLRHSFAERRGHATFARSHPAFAKRSRISAAVGIC
jgi:hypothetical protein